MVCSVLKTQLIDKNPSKAISLFWAAINAGDRVDSALKDMAVVMKQLDRAEEAIEAIRSFRHLCAFESQESLNNVLVELFKVKEPPFFTFIVTFLSDVIFLGRFELEIENQKFRSVSHSFCPSSICHPWLFISSI